MRLKVSWFAARSAATVVQDQIMASYTGQFVEGIEVDICSMSEDEVDTCLEGCTGVLVCATGRDAYFPPGDSEGASFAPSCRLIMLSRRFQSVSRVPCEGQYCATKYR